MRFTIVFLSTLAFLIFIFLAQPLCAQQLPDDSFKPQNAIDYFEGKTRPQVFLDAAHHNFHRLGGRYKAFGRVLESAGFSVRSNTEDFSAQGLSKADILIVANALDAKNAKNWDLPNYPAFSRAEIEAVFNWVRAGGSLMLIADHMPFPKAAAYLAEIFGFQFLNGYVEIVGQREQYFQREDRSLVDHPIVRGQSKAYQVDSVRGFMGQAFLVPPQARPLMSFTRPSIAYMPSLSWVINDSTPIIQVQGWHQAATMNFGKGRIAVFGEAGMFTAQVQKDGDEIWKMGLSAEGAEQNERFLINTMLWLAQEL